MPDLIFDTCVLSNFALIDRSAILEGLYARRASSEASGEIPLLSQFGNSDVSSVGNFGPCRVVFA